MEEAGLNDLFFIYLSDPTTVQLCTCCIRKNVREQLARNIREVKARDRQEKYISPYFETNIKLSIH